MEERALPHSLEAERAVLGGLMLDSVSAMDIAELLEPGDFYREAHGKLYELLLQMTERGEPTEMVAVVEKIAAANRGEEMGGLSYVSSLPDNVPSTENIEYYAKIVRERAVVRRLLAGLTDVAERARAGTDELPELLDYAESTIFRVTQEKTSSDWQPLSKVVDQEFMRIQQLSERSGEVTGISTGFIDLDKMLAGLHTTDLIILAARPAMGKCLAADSLILMDDGSRKTIATVVKERRGRLLTLDRDLKLTLTEPSDFIDNGIKPVFEVRTRLGRRVRVTVTHPFLTVRGWRSLELLSAGDRIAVPRELPVFGTQTVGEPAARAWGRQVADGSARAPDRIFCAPEADVAAFLHEVFVMRGECSSSAGQPRIGWSTHDGALARQIQHLLLRFSVIARLSEVDGGHHLIVERFQSVVRFFERIGHLGDDESSQRVYAAAQSGVEHEQLDAVPAAVWTQIKSAKGAMSWAELEHRALSSPGELATMTGDVDRNLLSRIGEVLDSGPLLALARSAVFWDEIVAIEPLGEQQVYDLTIPHTHNFVAEDICVHNTALALNIALNAARTGAGVGIFSLEMSAGQLATRLLCVEGRVDAGKVRTGFLSRDQDWPNLTQAAETLYRLPVYLDDTPGLNVTQVRSKARRLKSQMPELGLIVLDYIGLMSGDGRVSRQEQIAQASRGLKALAKELDVCVLALSQLNRAVEQRNPKIPQISDLRESGAIEQDADIIMFIYRDEYYNKESARQGEADIIIAKQRNGPTGTAVLYFEGKFTRFDNLARNVSEGGYL